MKTVFSVMSLLMVFTLNAQELSRKEYNFNSDWKLQFGDIEGAEKVEFEDDSWTSVALPHAFNQDEAFEKAIDALTTGISWYRKTFKP